MLTASTCAALVFDVEKDWLEARIRQRFDLMLEQGALDEAEAMKNRYDPELPSCKAIGVPELMRYLDHEITMDEAREQASVATRQFAKRQRTWFRSKMKNWMPYSPTG